MAPQDLVFFVVVVLVAYLLIIRPQRMRARQLQDVREALAVGRRVMTTAGLFGTVAAVEAEQVVLEIADGVQVRFASAAVVRVFPDASSDSTAPADREASDQSP